MQQDDLEDLIDEWEKDDPQIRSRVDAALQRRTTLRDIEAHAAFMEAQPWWDLHVAEQALPPCLTCGGPLELLLDGTGWCDDCEGRGGYG